VDKQTEKREIRNACKKGALLPGGGRGRRLRDIKCGHRTSGPQGHPDGFQRRLVLGQELQQLVGGLGPDAGGERGA